MFNVPAIPQMNYRASITIDDKSIIIDNWIGNKQCTLTLQNDNHIYLWNITGPESRKAKNLSDFVCASSIYNFYNIISHIAAQITVSKATIDPFANTKQNKRNIGILKSVQKRVAQSIAKKLAAAMRIVISKYMDKDVNFIHRKFISTYGIKKYNSLFGSVGGYGHRILNDCTKEDFDLWVKDIRNGYTAALQVLLSHPSFTDPLSKWADIWIPSTKTYNLYNPGPLNQSTKNIKSILMKTFLNKFRIPYDRLHHIITDYYHPRPLHRVYSNALELKIFLFTPIHINRQILIDAPYDRILKSKELLEKHLREKLDFRKTLDIKKFINFLLDYPNKELCQLVKLMEKSIDWHIEERKEAIKRAEAAAARNKLTKMALPPIPLPVYKGVRFLESAQDVLVEGADMGHCVGSYAKYGEQGRCYLFHVDYKGDKATAEVSNTGDIAQIHGPYNKDAGNKAVVYGKQVLKKWGTVLKKYLEEGNNRGKSYVLNSEMPAGMVNVGRSLLEEGIFDEIPF